VLSPILDSVFARRFDRLSNRSAFRKLQLLEKLDGRPLSRRLRREADAYAVDVLGSKAFAPWLYVYAKHRGDFVEGWIPGNFFARVVIPNVNGVLRFAPRIKTFTAAVFDSDLIPDVGTSSEAGCTVRRSRRLRRQGRAKCCSPLATR